MYAFSSCKVHKQTYGYDEAELTMWLEVCTDSLSTGYRGYGIGISKYMTKNISVACKFTTFKDRILHTELFQQGHFDKRIQFIQAKIHMTNKPIGLNGT